MKSRWVVMDDFGKGFLRFILAIYAFYAWLYLVLKYSFLELCLFIFLADEGDADDAVVAGIVVIGMNG